MANKFVCPVKVVDRKGNSKECGKKFNTLEDMLKHADKVHGGRGREL